MSNTRGAAVLAADACGDVGLQVAALAADTQRALRDMLGRQALVAGPVDTTALVGPGRFRECLELVGADPGVDAVLALTTKTAGSDLVPEAGRRAAAGCRSPRRCWTRSKWSGRCQAPAGTPLRSRPMPTPSPPSAPWATPRATAPGGRPRRDGVPDLEGLRQDRAGELVAGVLASPPRGGWLAPDPTVELLGCYGVPLTDSIGVITEDAAVAAAAQLRRHRRAPARTCPACCAPAPPATC